MVWDNEEVPCYNSSKHVLTFERAEVTRQNEKKKSIISEIMAPNRNSHSVRYKRFLVEIVFAFNVNTVFSYHFWVSSPVDSKRRIPALDKDC